jgi:hypothetical protein
LDAAAVLVSSEAADETPPAEEEQEAAPEISAEEAESEEPVAVVSSEETAPDAVAEEADTPTGETLEAVAILDLPETAEQVPAPNGTESAATASDVGGGGGEVENLLAATHRALRELSERFAATVDHIGSLLSSTRRSEAAPQEVDTPAEVAGEASGDAEAVPVESVPVNQQEADPAD